MVVLDGWTAARLSQFGEIFLSELRKCNVVPIDQAIESCFVEVSKSDKAMCNACREKIAAIVPKLLVKFARQEEGKEDYARSFHLGCASAISQLDVSIISLSPTLTVRQREIVTGFLQAKMCTKCLVSNSLASVECSACKSVLEQ
jgi:hypothetical protein